MSAITKTWDETLTGSKRFYRQVSIKSTSCGAYTAELMDIHAGSPALLMMQWINGEEDLTIPVSETVWRANALEFVVEPGIRR
ncbi:MAG: hypothetical protein GY896_25555 [Gammaproteobacteria bacterium]|nr:hypothetical protein [Gammaproteobacteria bacterium]